MRKSSFLILVILAISTIATLGFYIRPVRAVIWIGGNITSDTTWTPVDTYRVINDTYVDLGATLTILPGVHIQLADGFSLIVQGSLNATGTDADPIVFTSSDVSSTPGVWNTIKFTGASNDYFALGHAVVEFALNGITIQSLGHSIISRSTITNCSQSGILINGISNLVIKENAIERNDNGISTDNSAHADIAFVGNAILSNRQNGISLNAYGGSPSVSNVTFSSNTVSSNTGDGISVSAQGAGGGCIPSVSNVTFSSNTVSSNTEDGISLNAYADYSAYSSFPSVSNVAFSSNTVSSNTGNGIFLNAQGRQVLGYFSYANTSVSNVTFLSNTASSNGQNGLYLNAYADGPDTYASNVAFSFNNASSNTGNGIYVNVNCPSSYAYASDLVFSSNTALCNGQDGICLYSSGICNVSKVAFSSNTALCNGQDGICLNAQGNAHLSSYVSGLAFSYNTAISNVGNGIILYVQGMSPYVSNVAFSSNTALCNGQNGLEASASNVTFSSNTASSNRQNGIYLVGGHSSSVIFDVTVLNNKLGANKQDAVCITGGAVSNVTGNSILYNLYGAVFETVGNLAYHNDLYSNIYGMTVTAGGTVSAKYNYWGDLTGPYQPSLNPEGKGNPVNGNGIDLDFIPFLPSPQGPIRQLPVAALSVNTKTPSMNETVTFSAVNSTSDGRIDYYSFDFGDGTNSSWTTQPGVLHQYSSAGLCYAKLTVMDDYGVTSNNAAVQEIIVSPQVPEFPSFLVALLFMLSASFALILGKKHRSTPK